MAGLGGGMDDEGGALSVQQGFKGGAVADVQFVVAEILVGSQQPALVPAGVASRAEELSPHVVVNPMDFPAELGEVIHHFRADESGGTGYEEAHRTTGLKAQSAKREARGARRGTLSAYRLALTGLRDRRELIFCLPSRLWSL